MSALTVTRRCVLAIWLCLLALVVAAAVIAHAAPLWGYRLMILRGPSMGPAVPIGALAFEERVRVSAIQPGDVVTFTLPSGSVVTHRVLRVATADGELQVETKGDANTAADPGVLVSPM